MNDAEAITAVQDAPLVVIREEPTPLMLIDKCIERGMNMGDIKDLIQLARQHKADLAAEAWALQVTRFQSKCLMVKKEREAKGAKFSFKYASLDDVMDVARPHLQECGLVVSFTSKPVALATGPGYEVTCLVRHGTHVEPTTITLPCNQASKMDDVQAFGSLVSYGKRYALCAALNIIISDEDDDALKTARTISQEQATEIRKRLGQLGKDETQFLGWVKKFQPAVEKVEDIAEVHHDKVMDTIGRMKGAKK